MKEGLELESGSQNQDMHVVPQKSPRKYQKHFCNYFAKPRQFSHSTMGDHYPQTGDNILWRKGKLHIQTHICIHECTHAPQ